MRLNNEQKKTLTAVGTAILTYVVGFPFFMWVFGRLDSWKDVFLYDAAILVIGLLMGAVLILGSKTPKKK